MTNQLYTISLKSRNKTALVSPMRCKFVFLQVGSPSKKTDLSVRSLKRSSERNKQRKWWCRVPVWLERYQGLIRTDTGKLGTDCALVPPNALFVLWNINMKHYIYLIQEASHKRKNTGCVKIGRSKNVETRLMELQVGNSRELLLIAKIGPYTPKKAEWLEKQYHRRLKRFRIRGEWFHFKCLREMSAVI